MNKNKYIVFISIGFELVSLVLFALWFGGFLGSKGYDAQTSQAFCVLGAFLIWFISLLIKLKKLKND